MQIKCRMPWLVWICALLFLGTGCATGLRGLPPVGGIANFDEVNPHLYRGAQPDRAGLEYLHRLGIRTVIDLRMTNDVRIAEAEEVRAQGMNYFNVPMSGSGRPKMETVLTVLSIIETSPSPVFVHCHYGCDRTGTIIACYRMKHEEWKSSKALNEARIHGMYWWKFGMKNFVSDFEQHSEARSK